MYSQLLRCVTLKGSSTGFSWFSPTKVEPHKSFLLTESSPILKINLVTLGQTTFFYVNILIPMLGLVGYVRLG